MPWRWPAIMLVALVSLAVASPAVANTVSAKDPDKPRVRGLSAKERKAIDVRKATVRAAEDGGLQVEATFRGNIEKALGRGKLKRAIAAIVLVPRPGVQANESVVATSGKGFGKLRRDTSSKDVAVHRDGKRLLFTVAGSGAENVGSVAVKVFVKRPRPRASAAGDGDPSPPSLLDLIAELGGDEELVIEGLTGADACDVLKDMIFDLSKAIAELRKDIKEARGREKKELKKERALLRRLQRKLKKAFDENCGQPTPGPVEIVFTVCSGPHGGMTSDFDVDVEVREAGNAGARAATAIGAGASVTITLVPPNDSAVIGPKTQTKTLDGAGKGHFDFEINQFGDYTAKGSAKLKDGRTVSGQTQFNVGLGDPACTR